MTLTAIPQPADFVVLPMAQPGGVAVEVAQWVEQVVETHQLATLQHYEHAEVYIGKADNAGPYGYTISTYPNRAGRRALPRPWDQIPGAIWSSGLVTLTYAQRTAIVNWCDARPAVPYSALDYLALTGHALGLNTDALRSFIADQGHMICSQFTDAAYMQAGAHLFTDNRWPGYVTPLDLALLLKSRGAVVQ